ncbi:MAG: nicotinamide-nucleotide amidohydrolase family protein [Clostridium sp.]
MNIEDKIGKFLCDSNISISIAESLTGGLVCGRIVNYPGISKVFKEGVVAYSVESKIRRLNVSPETIELYTDVSEETAIEMAKGIALISGSRIGVSTTGNAGPEGDPVGLVYIGIYIDGRTSTYKSYIDGNRQEIRNKVVDIVLDKLFEKIKGIE